MDFMEEKIDKIYKLVVILVALVSISLVLSLVSLSNGKKTTTDTEETTTQESNYDVSMMDTLDLEGVLDLFGNKKGYSVVYLGRSTCSACVSFLPTLQEMQEKYEYTTKYLDITTVNSASDEFEELMDKLSTEVTLTVNGETATKSFGEFYGYTPMTFIIKDGKFKDGIVGAYSEEKFEQFLNDNGIK